MAALKQNLDASIFDYDGVYDTIKDAERQVKQAKLAQDAVKKPKYIDGILESAEQRKRDRLRAEARTIQKQRQAEGDEFADKESFVTNAYKEQQAELAKAEALVHHITIFAGITSVLLLCLAYTWPSFLRIPALVFVALSIFYSVIDEGLHWHRYMTRHSDRVEMWSHFFIFVGHLIMIIAWWVWFDQGYPGVESSLAAKTALFGF